MKDVMKMLFGGDFQSQVYKKGGMLNAHQRYVLELEGLSGVRKEAIESYINENNLSDNDVLNIVIGLGRKQLIGSDVSSAVVGVKGNDYSKKIIAFAKENKGMKMYDGGNFQSGVYAEGGSLEAHGIKEGDTFIKTISGVIQKVKDKDGKIVYINLSTGERDTQPPLPFENGGGVQDEVYIKYLNKDKNFKEDIKYFKSYDEARKWGRENLENFNSDMIYYKYENGGAMSMTEDKKAFGGSLFSKVKMMPKANKYPNYEDKDVVLKNGKLVKVFSQSDNNLTVMEIGKMGSGVRPTVVDISEVETVYKNGGALVGNQKRIDMNKNGKIDAEDFKLLRSSMNGAWRNDHKHVNHNEDYEIRYAKPRPQRKGYKGKRKFADGGSINIKVNGLYKKSKFINDDYNWKSKLLEMLQDNSIEAYNIYQSLNKVEKEEVLQELYEMDNDMGSYGDEDMETSKENLSILLDDARNGKKYASGGGISNFERLSRVVAKNYEGKRVKPQYQKDYGKRYSTSEAREVGNRVAGKMKMMKKAESGTAVAKGNRGGVMVLAKKIRKDGESWKDALKRAGQQIK